MRASSSPGAWPDCVLFALLVLSSIAALIYGACSGHHCAIGLGLFGLAGAIGVAAVLFDRETLNRAAALRAAAERARRALGRNP